MKSACHIISHIKNSKTWPKLKEADEISKLIHSLTLEVRKYIAFAFKRDQILYVALSNPNFCAEFNNYIAPTLLQILSSCREHFPSLSQIANIKAYFPSQADKRASSGGQQGSRKQRSEPNGAKYFTPPRHKAAHLYEQVLYYHQGYPERCKEGFSILSQNTRLRKIFESILEQITR